MFLLLGLGDCQPALTPPQMEFVEVSSCESMTGRLESGIRYGEFLLHLPQRRPNASPPLDQPDPSLPVDVTVTDDNRGQGGHWYQTFVLKIQPMGTLADVSTVVYGDESHASELLLAFQRRYPDVTSPSLIQVGQEIEITVDASRTHVLKRVTSGATKGSVIREFYNGVKEMILGPSSSAVVRIVEFPADAPTDSFQFRRGEQEITVPRGNKLVEYSYEPGDSFEETVKSAYGTLSARAIQDFESQTRWQFSRWPPASGETAEAIISTTRSYEDEAFEHISVTLPDPVTNAKFQELLQMRAKAGIYPMKLPPNGITYRVTVVDSSVTARRVAELLYNSPARYLDIVEASGIRLETADPAALPADFDVPLIGRSFDILVDFADEDFVLEQVSGGSGDVIKTTRLLNGTVIEEYSAAEKGLKGMQQTAYYPNGYRRLVYRPDDTLVAFFDFVYFTMKVGQVDNDEDRRAFIATMLWNWLRDIPRSPGDVAEQLTLRDDADGRLVEALVWHRDKIGLTEMILYRWWTINPCLALVSVVFGASGLFMVAVILIRKAFARRDYQ